SPTFAASDWSGESYRSYLDFVLTRDDLDYCTVDVDFGCGIIFKNRTADIVGPVDPKLVAEISREKILLEDLARLSYTDGYGDQLPKRRASPVRIASQCLEVNFR